LIEETTNDQIIRDDESSKNAQQQAVEKAVNEGKRLEIELRRLDTLYNPRDHTTNNEFTTFRDDDGNEKEMMVNFCFHSVYHASDAAAPKAATHSEEWILSMASEIMNFLKRKCWKKVPRSIPNKADRKIMKTMWQFKHKIEQDKSI
jgi:hypothetical protein